MLGAAIVWISLGAISVGDYLRPFGSPVFDQATLDAEGFGDKKSLAREADGLRVTLAPRGVEAGWKTPPALRLGGDLTIKATLLIRKLPKPGGEDGAAIGLAVATQNVDQPEATLLREVEPDGKEVFRTVDKGGNPNGMGNQQQFDPFTGQIIKPAKPARLTFPAQGMAIRLEVHREGSTLRYLVGDDKDPALREIGHFEIGAGDIAGVKLFTSNRSGAEPLDVLFRDLTIRADRISGLGTAIRTVFGTVVHGDPVALEGAMLALGTTQPGPPPPPSAPAGAPVMPAQVAAADDDDDDVKVAVAPAGATVVAFVPTPIGGGVPGVLPPAGVPIAPGAPAPGQAAPVVAGPPPPPQVKDRIPLDEVETIAYERAATLGARYLGQPNVDTTGPAGESGDKDKPSEQDKDKAAKDKDKDKPKESEQEKEKPTPKPAAGDDLSAPPPGTAAVVKIPKVVPKPNGVRDLHLSLSSLREVAIQQVMIQCQTDKGATSWQLDTTGTPAWPLTMSRAGLETWADLFLEPPPGDCHDKEFTITLTYADGQQANTKAKATEHTDPKLKFDPGSPTPALDVRVFLAGDEQLFGKLDAIHDDLLTLTTPWGDRLDLPMTRIVGVYMGMPDHKETPEAFAKRLKAPGDQDLLLARAKDGEIVAIAGIVEGVKANKLSFLYQEKSRTLPLKGIEGMILATRTAPAPPTDVRPTFRLAGGIVLSGRWVAIDATAWPVETAWGQVVKLPAAEVRTVRVRGGQMTYLSDLIPSQVAETPYFGRRSPYRQDLTLAGTPLKLSGQVIDKGLAVHSRSSLTYDLDKRYTTFEALVGFDEAGKRKGRVDCRVFADGREIYGNPDLRADAEPVSLSLPVVGAEQLKLVIDFGADEDTGDRVIWGNARVYRRPPTLGPTKTATKSTTTTTTEPTPPARPTTPSPPSGS